MSKTPLSISRTVKTRSGLRELRIVPLTLDRWMRNGKLAGGVGMRLAQIYREGA